MSKKPTIVFVPGGPGLSSRTLRNLAIVESHFNPVFYDPPGTGDRVAVEKQSYQIIVDDLNAFCSNLSDDVIICGHSFGGIIASEVFLNSPSKISALICISTPYSPSTFVSIDEQYTKNKSKELDALEKAFEANPTDETFKKWLAKYGPLYFTERNVSGGATMLLSDRVSVSAFLGARSESSRKVELLEKLKRDSRKKVFIAGLEDKLFLPALAKDEAVQAGFRFYGIANSGHFSVFEAPKELGQIFKSEFLNKEEK